MGQWTEHTSVGAGGCGGPVLGPQRVYRGERGGPVHHTMVGPQHMTRVAQREKLPAQSRTWVVAGRVKMLTEKKKKHGGTDSDPFRYRIPSPSSHSLHRIY